MSVEQLNCISDRASPQLTFSPSLRPQYISGEKPHLANHIDLKMLDLMLNHGTPSVLPISSHAPYGTTGRATPPVKHTTTDSLSYP